MKVGKVFLRIFLNFNRKAAGLAGAILPENSGIF
jgi:hypothetical protein